MQIHLFSSFSSARRRTLKKVLTSFSLFPIDSKNKSFIFQSSSEFQADLFKNGLEIPGFYISSLLCGRTYAMYNNRFVILFCSDQLLEIEGKTDTDKRKHIWNNSVGKLAS